MTRRHANVTQAEIARALRAVKQTGCGMAVEVVGGIIRIIQKTDLPEDKTARNANGYVESRLADAPWAKLD